MFFAGENIKSSDSRKFLLRHIIRKIFLEDWMMKLVALIITLGLWLGVTGLSTPTITRFSGVPLTLRISNDAEITNVPIQDVDIVLSGDKRRISQLNKSDLQASIDLTDSPMGDRLIPLSPDTVSLALPPGIKLDEVQPDRVAVRLEAVEEKELPVTVETTGNLPEGFEIYAKTVMPARVHVRGPASFLKTLTSVATDKVDLTDRTEDFIARQVGIPLGNPKALVLENVVDIDFRVGEKRIERLYLVNIDSAQPARRATVVLFGPRSLFAALTAADMNVQIENGSPKLTLPPQLEGRVQIRELKTN